MVEPYYAGPRATLYRGDALAVLRELPDASVDALITDPPYSSGGMMRGDRMDGTRIKYVNSASGSQELADFTGDNRDQRAYGYWCTLWLSECLRIAKPGAACVLFTDWRQLPTTTDMLQSGGWVWRGIVPWHKPAGRNTQGRFANTCEYAVWGTAGPRPGEGHETLPGFYQAHPPRDREHITQKPVDVLRSLVRISPADGVVLDPFCGSGTTGVAAIIEGRRFIGAELSAHYAEVAAKRLAVAAMQPGSGEQSDIFGELGAPA
jgi:site-specific DNA-methyltransferase (adenine-specific)